MESQFLDELRVSLGVLQNGIDYDSLFLLDISQQVRVGTALSIEQLQDNYSIRAMDNGECCTIVHLAKEKVLGQWDARRQHADESSRTNCCDLPEGVPTQTGDHDSSSSLRTCNKVLE